MEPVDRMHLAKHRLRMARAKLETAELLLRESRFADAASRAYYALLHAARALLAK